MIHLLSFHYIVCQKNTIEPCAHPMWEPTLAVYVPARNLDASKACNLALSMYRSCIICCSGMMRRLVIGSGLGRREEWDKSQPIRLNWANDR